MGCGGRIVDAGGGVVGLRRVDNSGGGHCRSLSRHRWWWSHCHVVDGGGGVVVASSTEVVRWRWLSHHRLGGGGVAGVVWWKMERVRTRDLEKILKCPCLHVFVYIIISAH